MSIPALEWAWNQDGLSGTEKNVLVVLAWHANSDGESIRPSVERLVRMTSLSRSTITEVRGRLEKRGLIERVGMTRGGVVEYRLPGVREPDIDDAQGVQEPGGGDREPGGGRPGAGPKRSVKGQEPSEGGVQKRRSTERRKKSDTCRGGLGALRRRYEPRRTELDKEGTEIITAALNHATADECKRAIDGCAASPFHMGQNDKRRKFNGLSQILKGKRAGGPRQRPSRPESGSTSSSTSPRRPISLSIPKENGWRNSTYGTPGSFRVTRTWWSVVRKPFGGWQSTASRSQRTHRIRTGWVRHDRGSWSHDGAGHRNGAALQPR